MTGFKSAGYFSRQFKARTRLFPVAVPRDGPGGGAAPARWKRRNSHDSIP